MKPVLQISTKIAGAASAGMARPSGLLHVDQRAPDIAGAGEELEQFVALAPADGALQREQILLEAPEDLQHRLAVVEEYVAPHRWIGSRTTREVAEAAGGELDHL